MSHNDSSTEFSPKPFYSIANLEKMAFFDRPTSIIVGVVLVFVMVTSCWGDVFHDDVLQSYYSGNIAQAKQQLNLWVTVSPNVSSSIRTKRDILSTLISLRHPSENLVALPNTIPAEYHAYLTPVYFQQLLRWGDRSDVKAFLNELRNSRVNRFYVHQCEFLLANYYREGTRYSDALSILKKLIDKDVPDSVQEDALKMLVSISLQIRDQPSTLYYYGQILQRFPLIDQQFALLNDIRGTYRNKIELSDCLLDAPSWLNYLRQLFRDHLQQRTLDTATDIVETYPEFSQLGEVYFIQSMVLFQQYKYHLAMQGFKAILKDQSGNNRTLRKNAMFYLARSLQELGRNKAADTMYQTLIQSLKKSDPLIPKAYYYKTLLHYQYGTVNEFFRATKDISKRYHRSWYYDKLRWAFDPASQDQFQVSFESHQLITNVTNKTTNFDHYQWVYQAGLADIAVDQLRYQSDTQSVLNSDVAIAYLLSKKGQYRDAIQYLESYVHTRQLSEEPISKDTVRLYYPVYYSADINRYAKKFNVDPYLMLALAREQSWFSGDSVEGDRWGLFRLELNVMKELAWRLGHWFTAKEAFSTDRNTHYACYYMNRLQQQFDNDLYQMIMAFIESPSIALSYRDRVKASDPETIDQIKHQEIKSRLVDILNTYKIYQTMYPDLFNGGSVAE